MTEKKTISFDVTWRVSGRATMDIPANLSEEEAVEYVKKNFHTVKVPAQGEYLDDSLVLDEDSIELEE